MSVDTDIDSGLECGHISAAPAAPAGDDRCMLDSSDSDAVDEPSAAENALDRDVDGPVGDGDIPNIIRQPAGTWKVWESLWFYMIQNPGWRDVKLLMKRPLCNSTTGMGTAQHSKTMSPHLLGEQLEAPVRTMAVLRAWVIWRARHQGWAARRPCRLREVDRQLEALERDIKAVPGALLGNPKADAHLTKWLPDLVARLSAAAS